VTDADASADPANGDEAFRISVGLIAAVLKDDLSAFTTLLNSTDDKDGLITAFTNLGVRCAEYIAGQEDVSVDVVLERWLTTD
jgi:hypothetical protein